MKGVILAAGYGTRFLPGTKTIPKEMFPLIDIPAIHYIAQEMTDAGIQDILIVSSRRKKPMEDYFDREIELENTFRLEESHHKLKHIQPIEANVFFMRQQHMSGTGNALLLVEPFVGDSPFVVAYPDDLQLDGPSLTGQLIDLYRKTKCTVLSGQEILGKDISRFGVVATHEEDGVDFVDAMVEKPKPGTEPSRIVTFGRYLYTPEIFPALKETLEAFRGPGEFTQTDALNHLAQRGRVVIKRFEGKLVDVGAPMGYLEAIVEAGLHREEYKDDFRALLKTIAKREGLV